MTTESRRKEKKQRNRKKIKNVGSVQQIIDIVTNQKETTQKKPSCAYYEVLDMLKMGNDYDLGWVAHCKQLNIYELL